MTRISIIIPTEKKPWKLPLHHALYFVPVMAMQTRRYKGYSFKGKVAKKESENPEAAGSNRDNI